MIKKDYILILILIIIILSLAMAIISISGENKTVFNNTAHNHEVITNSSDDPGTVEVIKNIGNPDGRRIAYVVGVHPLENLTHKTLLKILPTLTDFNNSMISISLT